MSVENAQNKSEIVTDPEMVFKLKKGIVSAWNQLPPEHQSTMALMLIKEVQKGEWGEWGDEALIHQIGKEKETEVHAFPVYSLSRDNLENAFSEEEMHQLQDQDITQIVEEMRSGFLFDSSFWFAVRMIGQRILERDPSEI